MSKQNAKKRPSIFSTRALCSVAILTALTVVIAYLCKFLTITQTIRITFENLPIILAGFAYGPVAGAMTGVAADFISTLISQYGLGQMNPILTAAAGLIGLIAGVAALLTREKKLPVRLAFAVFPAHIIGNMILKTVGLYVWYRMPFFATFGIRVPLYAAISALEYVVLLLLLKSGGVKRAMGLTF